MFDPVHRWLLRVLSVPHEPAPPAGAPGSLRVFKSGQKYYRFRLGLWTIKQVVALLAFIFWFWVLLHWESIARENAAPDSASPPVPGATTPAPTTATAEPVTAPDGSPSNGVHRKVRKKKPSPRDFVVSISRKIPSTAFTLLWVLKGISLTTYLVQLPVTYFLMRLDYEQRWYMVTDRSLRLRSGVWSVRELTMSFANLQQITVSQGPLQRFLGLADVCVQSAGGGGATAGHGGAQQTSLHTGYFHAVENANEIRDLILERLRKFRESGLGDPDEHHPATALTSHSADATTTQGSQSLPAARDLLAEVRRLRSVVS